MRVHVLLLCLYCVCADDAGMIKHGVREKAGAATVAKRIAQGTLHGDMAKIRKTYTSQTHNKHSKITANGNRNETAHGTHHTRMSV